MNKLKLGLLMFIVISFACKKSIENNNETILNKFKTKARIINNDIMPSCENGILKFNSADAYFKYLELLDKYTLRDSLDINDTLLEDEKLANIEMLLPYTSLRSVLLSKFEVANEIGWERVEDIPDFHHVKDKTQQSVLNAQGEIIIGAEYICQSEKFDYVRIKNYTLSKIENYRKSKNEINFEQNNMDSSIEFCTKDMKGTIYNVSYLNKERGDTTWKNNSRVESDSYPLDNNCTNQNNVFYVRADMYTEEFGNGNTGTGYILPFINSNTTYDTQIDWGDGIVENFVTYKYQSVNANSPHHTYTTPNANKTVQIIIRNKMHYHTSFVTEKFVTLIIPPGPCRWVDKTSPWTWKYSNDSKAAMRGCIQSETQWLLGQCKYHAFTETFKWKNGKFRKRKMEKVYAKAYWDKYIKTCIYENQEVVEKTCKNDNNVNAKDVVTTYSDNIPKFIVIYSNHKFLYNDIWYNLDLEMHACD